MRQVAATSFEPEQHFFKPGNDGAALTGAHGLAQTRAGAVRAQFGFDAIELLDLAQEPATEQRRSFAGFIKLPADVRPTTGQRDDDVAAIDEGAIRRVTIALQRAGERRGNDRSQARGRAADLPAKKYVAFGAARRPEATLLGAPVARLQIVDRRFIHLHIAARQDAGADGLVNRLQPFGGQFNPTRQGLPGQMDLMPPRKNLFLPIQRQMIAVFGDQNLRQQTGRGQAAVLQPLRQRRDHRH